MGKKVKVQNNGDKTFILKDYLPGGKEKGVVLGIGQADQITARAYEEQKHEKIFSSGQVVLIGNSREDVELPTTEDKVDGLVKRNAKKLIQAIEAIDSKQILELIKEKDSRKTVIEAVNKRLANI